MRKILLGLVVVLTLFVIGFTSVAALSPEELQKQIDELSAKVNETHNRATSLASQIAYMDSQIRLTTLKITDTKNKIVGLEKEIDDMKLKIGDLEQSLTKVSEVMIDRIVATYKNNMVNPMTLLLSSDGFPDLLSRSKYLRLVQTHDKKLMFAIQATKTDFEEQKKLLEDKKKELDELNKKLQVQMVALDQQRKEKQVLLVQTKNDESTYQRLLSEAIAEKQAVERALVEGVKVGPVKRGDPIALVGNTGYPGCSTGAHLHFEIRKNNAWVDPGTYLSSKTINNEQNGGTTTLGNGGWNWPLQDTIELTQHYGKTPFSWRYSYSGGMHTGYDMTSTSSDVIRAPMDGTLYTSSQACGGSSIIKIKYIDHGDGVISFYLHVQ